MRRLLAALLFAGLVLPVPAAQAATPRFQVRCATSHLAQEDPIVSPGGPSAHLHEFFGNTTTNADSTHESMTAAGTTCTAVADTSGYWVPTVISPGGEVVRAKTILVYYRGAEGARTIAFPPDLRMVSHHSRLGADPSAGTPTSNIIIKFPSCWDGVHTDSANHISHMAEATSKGCPASHPVRVPALSIVARYPIESLADHRLSSGALSTMHADFWNTWRQAGLEELVDRCLNNTSEPCPKVREV